MAARTARYVAIGDSLSEGVGDDPWPDGSLRGWTDRLAEHLSTHLGGVEYANLAVRGLTAGRVAASQKEAALALEPDYVTLSAGMNDLLRPRVDVAEIRRILADLLTPFRERGAIATVVPIPDVSSVSPMGRLVESRRRALNGVYRSLADEGLLVPVVDTTGTIFEDRRAWSEDRLHLSPLGHERLALAAAWQFGVPVDVDWAAPPAGAVGRRPIGEDVAWVRSHVTPWIGRRLTGRSSGDGKTAKRPELALVAPRGGE